MSSIRPLVLVSSDSRQLDGFTWHAAIDTYLRSVFEVSALTPVIVPAFGEAILTDDLLQAAHAVLLTGSRSNTHPERYGMQATQAHEPFDQARDSTTLSMIPCALERGLPLLAICRGHQELNVAMGGTLEAEIQEHNGKADHRGGPTDAPLEQRFAPNHTVRVTEGGMLHAILGEQTLTVNSVHRQAIGRLGDRLIVEATAEDGTIEAISVQGAKSFALGVQWHPEYWASQSSGADAPSTAIFKAFGDAARAFASKG